MVVGIHHLCNRVFVTETEFENYILDKIIKNFCKINYMYLIS